jgi:hypothetical protein
MAAVPLHDLPNAVPEHDLPEGSQSALHPNMHYETGDWVMNQPTSASPSIDILGKLGDIWDASKLEGLAPEVTPIGGLFRLPSTEKAVATTQALMNEAKGSNVAQKLGALLSKTGGAIGSIPSKLLAFESGKNPEMFNTIYQAYKQNLPELKQAITEATPLGQKLYKDAIYNYGRAYSLPHDVAVLAEDQTKGNALGLGVHDLIAKQHGLYRDITPNAVEARAMAASNVYKPFNELNDAEKLKQATQAGVDTAMWNPIPAKTGENDLVNIAYGLGKKAILPSIFNATAPLSSPRIARMAAILAGQGANLVGKGADVATKVVNIFPKATLDDLINFGILGSKSINSNQGEQ